MTMGPEGNVSIKLDAPVASEVSNEFYKIVQQFEKMTKWFNDPNVPAEKKAPLKDVYVTGMAEMNFLYQFLQHCGYTKQQISEMANLPF